MRFFILLTFLFIYSECVFGKTFSECELANELRNQGIPMSKLSNWVCLATADSGRNSNAKSGSNDGSQNWGMFQINDKYWCTPGSAGKGCNVKCEDLRQDDITAAVRCAETIYDQQGFRASNGWKNHCRSNLPDLSRCFHPKELTVHIYD